LNLDKEISYSNVLIEFFLVLKIPKFSFSKDIEGSLLTTVDAVQNKIIERMRKVP